MRAQLRRLHSPDVQDLVNFLPDNPDVFGVLIQMLAGQFDRQGEESFDFILCTPGWLLLELGSEPVILGHHHLIVREYDYHALWKYLEKRCLLAEGSNWDEVAAKLSMIGAWEFDGYSA